MILTVIKMHVTSDTINNGLSRTMEAPPCLGLDAGVFPVVFDVAVVGAVIVGCTSVVVDGDIPVIDVV